MSDPEATLQPASSAKGRRRRLPRRWPRAVLLIALSLACAGLFVGSDVIERHLFPDMPIGWRHTLLTARAGIVIAAGCTVVYLLMRRQQNRLTRTAEQLAGLLESCTAGSGMTGRFENPYLAHCRDLLDCKRTECPMYDSPGERCWQIMTLSGASRGPGAPKIGIQQCHECMVYRRSCPDPLTELGESFNNLMYLLESEAEQVGRMRAQMVEKEKMVAIGQMAAGIAHEVGNPLSSISSIVQILKRAESETPDSDQLDLIEKHIQRISTTVRQLVSLARPGTEGWEQLDLGQVLREAVQLVGFDRRARAVEIESQCPESLPRTYGMRNHLQQVFINLALNALDAMPDGGKLRIRVQKNRRMITVRLADTGCGIPAETGRRVFEPFFTTKQLGHGTGLGLAVSYGIVQTHGGKIDFTSTVGEGTAFTVQIPILNKAPDS